MEKECLDILLRGTQPVVVCPARSLAGMRVPVAWRASLAKGRLLILSPFGGNERRATVDLAERRNELVAALADRIFVAYAEPGGKTEALVKKAREWGKPVLTFDSVENRSLIALGAKPCSSITDMA